MSARCRPLPALLAAGLATGLLAAILVPGGSTAAAERRGGGFSSTIRLTDCSASLVRFPRSREGDRAMMLTAGHCWEGGFLGPETTVASRPSAITGTVLDRRGRETGTVRAARLMYMTQDTTDVALYRLTRTFAQVRRSTGARPLTLASRGPVAGAQVTVPSAALDTVYRCQVQAVVPQLVESGASWTDAVRFAPGDPGCQTVSGTSGSPVVDRRTGLLVGVNNTIAPDDLTACRDDWPCEVAADGTRTAVPGGRYAEQTAPLLGCVTPRRTLRFDQPRCTLPAPTR